MLAYVGLTVAFLAREHPRLAALVVTVGIAAGMVGGVSNLAST
jgi:membrane-associated PAP2 superfamily phosphatase